MVDVPDERLNRLSAAVKPLKTTAAQVRGEDTPPASRAQRVAFARQADVLVKIARCFGPQPDPAAELEEFALDLVLADLASVEKRLDVVAKEARAGKQDARTEHEILSAAKEHLDGGKQLRTMKLEPDQRVILLGIFPVTLKPAVYVANAADELLPGGGEPAAKVAKLAAAEGAPVITLSARLEAGPGGPDPAEQRGMRAGYGIDRRGAGGWRGAGREGRDGSDRREEDSHRLRKAFHPRRGDLGRRACRGGLDGGPARGRQAARRRTRLSRPGR